MDKKEEKQKTYEILSKCDELCYAAKWKEIFEMGNTLLIDPNSTPTMLLTWIMNGKFIAYHGNLVEEYKQLLIGIDKRLEKEIGRERADKLLKFLKDELDKFVNKK